MSGLLLLNGLKSVDIGFFIGCGVAIALIIAVYYLIPVFNKKQYEEQRENLRKREAAFRANKGESVADSEEVVEEVVEEEFVAEHLESSVIGDEEASEIVARFDNISDSDIAEAVESSDESVEE